MSRSNSWRRPVWGHTHQFRSKSVKINDYRELYRTLKTTTWKSGLIIAFVKIALVNFTPAIKSYMISWDML